MRCDLHVHTRFSGMCTVPLLRRICRESYTEPEELFETMKSRGMDLVTVTDHDSIGAAAILGKHAEFFPSVEVTATMPSGTELHVGVYDLNERQHLVIQRRRADLEALVAYLREQSLFYTVNHAFSALTGRRAAEDWPALEQSFIAAETRNGVMPACSNRNARKWARQSRMITVGGSDAHSLRGAGRTWTEVRGARSKQEFLDGLRRGAGRARGDTGRWLKLTREVMDIGFSMLREDPRTWPLLPLAAAVPVVTGAAYLRELWFATRLGAGMWGGVQPTAALERQ